MSYKPRQIGTKKVVIEGKTYTVKVYAPGESENNPSGLKPSWKFRTRANRAASREMARQGVIR